MKYSWIKILLFVALIVYIPLWLWTIQIAQQQRTDLTRETILPVIGSDSLEYQQLTQSLLAGKGFIAQDGQPETFRTPGYPFFLAVILSFATSYFVVTFAQILLTVATAILLYVFLKKYSSEMLARVASLIYLVGINPITNSLVIMSDTLFVFLLLLVIHFIFTIDQQRASKYIAAGAILGFATLVRPIALFLAPVILIFFATFQYKKIEFKKTLIFSLLFCVAQIAVLTPWLMRNGEVSGYFAISSLSAYNLFHYNIPEYRTVTERVPIDTVRQEFVSQLSSEARARQKDLKYSAELKEISSAYLTDHFISYAVFHIQKTAPFFLASGWKAAIDMHNSFFPDDHDYGLVRVNLSTLVMRGEISAALKAFFQNPLTATEQIFWLLVVVAMAYALIRNPKNKIVWFFVLLVCYFAFLTGPVSYSRYRLPAEPFMLSLAVIGIMTLYKDIRFKWRRTLP